MTLQIGAMIVGLLLVSSASLWGLNGLRQDYGLALAGYQELRRVYDVGSHLSTAQTILAADQVDRAAARRQVEKAQLSFNEPESAAPLSPKTRQMLDDISTSISRAVRQLDTDFPGQAPSDVGAEDQRAVGQALPRIGSLTYQIRKEISDSEQAARHKLHRTMLAVGLLAGAVIAGSILLGIVQYRAVIRPLRDLNRGVRRIATGHFTDRLVLGGGEEFAALAQDFNGMAGELDGFYHLLEQKVAANTRELIRSERLASVGYLAAGVAHEINNPLGVIAGYAEYSIEQLKRSPVAASPAPQSPGCTSTDGDSTHQDIASALQIICEEAFRCKDITAKLLTLAHPGEGVRQRVSMPEVASAVIAIAGGLREYRDRHLSASSQPGADLTVLAVEPEMKQVVLNLVLNALEATPPQTGSVQVDVSRKGDAVLLAVTDNGRGMSPQTIERAFEPFFSERPVRSPDDARQHGTGLGLSITHAIVKDHAGRITAFSDGPGKGSRFTVELPAAIQAAAGNGSPS
jgi:two-component system, NtrC family, sensor kinase